MRWEKELVVCFRDGWADARARGVAAAWGFWIRSVGGLLATAWRQRVEGPGTKGDEARDEEETMATMATMGSRLDDRVQDVRHSFRMLRRGPGFAAAVLLTLGLSIGAATAVYTVVDGVLLRPLPYPEAERLYRVGQDGDDGSYWLSAPNYRDFAGGLSVFESMGAYTPDGANMVVEGEPARVGMAEADEGFFRTLGVEPVLGRTFTEAERAAAAPVAVVSHALWTQRMGARSDAIGSTLVLDGRAREVIGVLPAGPTMPEATDVWTPLALDGPEWRTRRGISWIQVVGRLRPDVDMEVVRAEAGRLSASLRESHPDTNRDLEIGLRSLEEATVGSVRTELRVLMAAVVLVLLVAAINVGGLLLARTMARQPEVAVRTAVGGGRGRLAAQLLTESAVLAALGGLLGVAFARVGVAGLLAVAPPGTPRLDEVAMGAPAFRFAAAAALVAALVFGILPAAAALRDPIGALRAARGGGGRRASRLRGGLVVAQVALALALLFGAGLLGKSFWRVQGVDLGFEPRGVLVAGLPIGDADFASAGEREAYYQRILDAARTLPGVRSAALTSSAPFAGFGVVFSYDLLDRPAEPEEERLARFRIVTPEVFATLGIPILRGRTLTPDETRVDGAPGALVSEELVRRHYGDADPVGRRIATAGDTFHIVGVVPSIRDVAARSESPFPYVYVPVMPAVRQSMTLVVRAEREAEALVEPVRRMVRALAPSQPVTPLRPLPELVSDSAARARFTLALLAFFAAATLLLAGVGLYGVLAYAVGRRTREIGVRVALGAPAGKVRALVIRQGLVLVGAGLALGTAVALWGGRFLDGLLYEVAAGDPSVLGAVAILLLAVALAAAWIPALRATRVDPAEALRFD
jgi:putative ABC transport system permease protein